MRRFIAATMLVLVALVSPAGRAGAAPGPHLSWDQCYADGKVANKFFACNTNSGSEVLVFSFESPVASSAITGIELRIQIASSTTSVPAWWNMFAAGSCRPTALQPSFVPGPTLACDDQFLGLAAGGIAAYNIDFYGPGTVRVLAAVAVPPPMTITIGPGTETFLMRLGISHSRTLGTPCAGCGTPVCIGFGNVNAVTPDPANNISVSAGGPNSGGGPSTVTWQGAYVTEYVFQGGPQFPFVSFLCAPDAPIPTRRQTWGSVKALYR